MSLCKFKLVINGKEVKNCSFSTIETILKLHFQPYQIHSIKNKIRWYNESLNTICFELTSTEDNIMYCNVFIKSFDKLIEATTITTNKEN